MKVIRPFTVTPAALTSNVPEAAPAEYNGASVYGVGAIVGVTTGTATKVYQSLVAGNLSNAPASSPTKWAYIATTYAEYDVAAAYALNDIVISAVTVGATHHAYQSLAAGNVGNALSDATKWLDLGATNRWAMFDLVNGTTTTSAIGIDVTVQMTGRADGVALLGVIGQSVRVTMTDATAGIVYDKTYSLLSDSGITDWYAYFSEEVVYGTDLVVTDLPLYSNAQVRVRITSTLGGVQCGTLVLGQTRNLGDAVFGSRAAIQDFSKKETDTFGNFAVIERSYAKRPTFKLVTDNSQIDAIYSLLSGLRATPCFWVGTEDYAMTWVYGFYKDFAVEITSPLQSEITLEIEGLT